MENKEKKIIDGVVKNYVLIVNLIISFAIYPMLFKGQGTVLENILFTLSSLSIFYIFIFMKESDFIIKSRTPVTLVMGGSELITCLNILGVYHAS